MSYNALFNGTTGLELQSYTSDSGHTFAKHPVYAAVGTNLILTTDGGRARANAATAVLYISSYAAPSADQVHEAVVAWNGTSGGYMHVCVRVDPVQDSFYFFRAQQDGAFQLAKRVGSGGTSGTQTLLGSAWTDTVASGDVRTMRIEVEGTSLRGYVGGTLRCTATDSSITAAGFIGYRASNGGSTVDLDSATAGALSVAATATTLTGATTGTTGVAIPLTVGINGTSAGVNVTPATNSTGTFSPSGAVARSTATQTGTVNYTPTVTGSHTISLSDDGGLTDANSLVITVSAADSTAPTLSSPSGTGGSLTCTGSVSTNEANGTLYAVVTASATAPSAAQVKAGQDHTGAAALRVISQAVSATGTQAIGSGAATAGTRYMHFMHEDAAANQSTVASSASFVVSAVDTTAPVLSSPVGIQTGSTTATVGATTDEGNGTMYAVVTASATQPSVSQIKAGQNNGGTAAAWSGNVAVSSTGAKTLSVTGLTASTAYYAHLVQADAATPANDSNRVSSASFTTAASGVAPTGTVSGQAVSGQDVLIDFTTANVPTSGTATLPAAGTPNGAVTQGPIAVSLTSGAGEVDFIGVPPGSYGPPAITLTNASGSTTIYGSAVEVLGFDGEPEASDPPDTTRPEMQGPITVSSLSETSYTTSIAAATDNVGVTAYQVSQNGGSTWIDKGTTRTHNHTGRTPGATDAVRWRASDAAGNWAIPLAAAVTLLGGLDPDPEPGTAGPMEAGAYWLQMKLRVAAA